ncbi:MAG: hypothetical protein KDC10_15755, partial [Calditrichaeota bacterium]|nr:hypothetical protein [Calditrichota bacterium]
LSLPFPPLAAPVLSIRWTGPGEALLSWAPVTGATAYTIFAGESPSGPWLPLESVSGTTHGVAVPDESLRFFVVSATQ